MLHCSEIFSAPASDRQGPASIFYSFQHQLLNMSQGGRGGRQLVEHLYHRPRPTVLCTQESLKTLPVQMAALTNFFPQ